MTRVVLVRPWTSASTGRGCCSAGASDVCLDHPSESPSAADAADSFVSTYRGLLEAAPAADVQIVSVTNTGYLLPWAYRAARKRHTRLDAWRVAMRATKPGTVLVDGCAVGAVTELGVDGILRRLETAGRD